MNAAEAAQDSSAALIILHIWLLSAIKPNEAAQISLLRHKPGILVEGRLTKSIAVTDNLTDHKCLSLTGLGHSSPHNEIIAYWLIVVFPLQSRGCPLKGLPSTPTLEAHRQRFLTNGWEKADAVDLDTIYKHHLDPQDKRRYATYF